MVAVYIVRCNFAAPSKEAAWNSWYSGPKIAQMLEKPFFRTCQRFRRTSGIGRNYLALWTMLTPEALKTPEYLSQWGFDRWSSDIADWSRDLFDGGGRPETDFATASGDAMHVITFDGMTIPAAEVAQRDLAAAQPGMMWLPVIGLDRHTPALGLRVLKAGDATALPAPAGVQASTYEPISEFHVTRADPARVAP